MQKHEINDIRSSADFRGISFSKHKKTDVKRAFFDSLLKGQIEQACHWSAELVCAGHYLDLWENILFYASKHVHIGNPKLPGYLEKRYTVFKNLITSGQFVSPLDLRNNPTIRSLFAEITSILCLCTRRHSFEVIKINRKEEFDITFMTERLKAPNISFVSSVFQDDDPKELFIPMNELAYNISSEQHNTLFACYWIEWILEFETLCKKRKERCYCARRSFVTAENKFARDLVWVIWDIIFHSAGAQNPFIKHLLQSCFKLFSLHYTNACGKKRRYTLYFAVSLCCDNINPDIQLVNDKHKVELAVTNINSIYTQIKKNEESPNTDYLFSGLNKQNSLAKSLERMNLINAVQFGTSLHGEDEPNDDTDV